jgi:hypothetical protein
MGIKKHYGHMPDLVPISKFFISIYFTSAIGKTNAGCLSAGRFASLDLTEAVFIVYYPLNL